MGSWAGSIIRKKVLLLNGLGLSVLCIACEVHDFNLHIVASGSGLFGVKDGNIDEVVTADSLKTVSSRTTTTTANPCGGIRIVLCLGVKPKIERVVGRNLH